MKKIVIITTIMASLLLGNVAAKAAEINNSNQIPKSMKPGTVLEYDKNSNMKIVIDGKGTASNDKIDLKLPAPKPGIRVAYDGTGTPSIVKNTLSGEIYDIDASTKVTQNKSNNLVTTQSVSGPVSWAYSGWITWFTDRIGQQDHVLQNYDCATKMSVDNPPCGTSIVLKDNNNGRSCYLTKWDVGSLPNAVLDIRPYVFTNIFGYNTSIGHFSGTYGYLNQ